MVPQPTAAIEAGRKPLGRPPEADGDGMPGFDGVGHNTMVGILRKPTDLLHCDRSNLRLNVAYTGQPLSRERLWLLLQLSQEMIDDLLELFLVREIHPLESDDALRVEDINSRP